VDKDTWKHLYEPEDANLSVRSTDSWIFKSPQSCLNELLTQASIGDYFQEYVITTIDKLPGHAIMVELIGRTERTEVAVLEGESEVKTMNSGQSFVLLVGCCVAIGMGVYVPKVDVGASKYEDGSINVWLESSGYHFILDENDLVVNIPRLCVQWAIVGIITFVLYEMCGTQGRGQRYVGGTTVLGGDVIVRRKQSKHKFGRTIAIRKKTSN